MNIKSKVTAALFAALTVAAPLALSVSPADAAPAGTIQMARHDHDNSRRDNHGRTDMYHDRNHRPPMKPEYRPHKPHGHYHWRAGRWNWRSGMWVWAPGLWVRF